MNRRFQSYGFFIAILFFGIGCWYLFPYRVDDAYISYRYTANLFEGHGYVFNQGQWVEGNSNLLWSLLLIIPYGMGMNLYYSSVFLGIISWFGAVAVIFGWSNLFTSKDDPVQTWFIAASLIFSVALLPIVNLWILSGMELGFYCFLLYAGLLSGNPIYLLLASLTRPEGVVFFVLIPLLTGEQRTKKYVFSIWIWIAISIVRFSLYGSFIPWTVHAKMGPPLQSLSAGGQYLIFGIQNHYGIVFFLIGVSGLFFVRPRKLRIRLIGFVITLVFVVLGSGGDWMPYSRLLIPLSGLLALGWGFFTRQMMRMDFKYNRTLWGSMILFLMMLNVLHYSEVRAWSRHLNESVLENKKVINHMLSKLEPDVPKIMALADIGAFGWEARSWRIIDRVGLVTPSISDTRNGLYRNYEPDFVLSKKPTLIQTHLEESVPRESTQERGGIQYVSLNEDTVRFARYATWQGGEVLYKNRRFHREYRILLSFHTAGNPINVFWIRKEFHN